MDFCSENSTSSKKLISKIIPQMIKEKIPNGPRNKTSIQWKCIEYHNVLLLKVLLIEVTKSHNQLVSSEKKRKIGKGEHGQCQIVFWNMNLNNNGPSQA